MLEKFRLVRFCEGDYGIFGAMSRGGIPLCVTLEKQWRDNARNISCIPSGIYSCAPHNGAKYKNVWRLDNVPGRDGILIHAGNFESETQGCILVGSGFLSRGISNSQAALDKLRLILPKTFQLEIINAYQGV